MTPIDAAVDAPPDVLVVPGDSHHYVVDSVLLPANNTQARNYGLDLDNDTVVDNQLGMAIAALSGQGFDNQAAMSEAIAEGDVIMLGSIRASSLTTASPASFTIFQGTNPMPSPCASPQDTTCRKHLAGTGSFSIDPNAPIDPPLVGSITASKLTAGPGHLTIGLAFWYAAPVTVTLLGARVELTPSTTSFSGKLAGGISQTDVNTKIIPALRDGFQAVVVRDCTMLANPPGCGCPDGSEGKTMIGLFDTSPQDCTISVAEVQNNSLIQSLLAPDVTVEGMQALSVGVAVTAVPGTFTEPM